MQVLAGFVAAGAALLANKAEAVTPVDLFDDRKARDTGFDLIYEARDLDLPQSVRDGLTQVCVCVMGVGAGETLSWQCNAARGCCQYEIWGVEVVG